MFGTQEKTAYKNIDSAKRKKIKMFEILWTLSEQNPPFCLQNSRSDLAGVCHPTLLLVFSAFKKINCYVAVLRCSEMGTISPPDRLVTTEVIW